VIAPSVGIQPPWLTTLLHEPAHSDQTVRDAFGLDEARCSPPPSQTASWLRPRSRRRRNDVGGRIIIGDIRNEPLANDVGGEQTLNIGKAGQIAQKVAPSPGSAVSYVTSAHDVTCQG
jgi:hypothetical protein